MVPQIFCWEKAPKTLLERIRSEHIADQLLDKQHPFEITFVQPLKATSYSSQAAVPDQTWLQQYTHFQARELIESILIVLAGFIIAAISDHFIGYTELALIFVVTVLVVAMRARMLMTLLSVFVCFYCTTTFY